MIGNQPTKAHLTMYCSGNLFADKSRCDLAITNLTQKGGCICVCVRGRNAQIIIRVECGARLVSHRYDFVMGSLTRIPISIKNYDGNVSNLCPWSILYIF